MYSLLLKKLSDKRSLDAIIRSKHGLEKESLRTTTNGEISYTDHPQDIGDPLKHPFITTDFAESQLEFITPTYYDINEALRFMKLLHVYVLQRLPKDEYLWPFSMPCVLPDYEKIPIAKFGDSPEGIQRHTYRKGLAARYGKYMQVVCGTHYNFSFDDSLLEIFFETTKDIPAFQEKKNQLYFALARNFFRYRWVLVYLFGASPVYDKTYTCKHLQSLRDTVLEGNELYYSTSLRMSRCGYSNADERNFLISYNSLEEYINGLEYATNSPHPRYSKSINPSQQLNGNILQNENEYYSPIRIKGSKKYTGNLEALKTEGVEYMEFRIFDLNPFEDIHVSYEQCIFIHIFIYWCILNDSPLIDEDERKSINDNQTKTALIGRKVNVKLVKNHEAVNMHDWLETINLQMNDIASVLDEAYETDVYSKTLSKYFTHSYAALLPSQKICDSIDNNQDNYVPFGIQTMKAQKKKLIDTTLSPEIINFIEHAE